MSHLPDLDCAAVDELAASYAVGALDPTEERAFSRHLAACDQPHAELRDLVGAATLVADSLPEVAPSSGLRGRLMATVAETPQEHRRSTIASSTADAPTRLAPARRAWWQIGPLPSAVAAGALAAAVGLGAWGISLSGQLAEREAALRAVASADAAYVASGDVGRGWVIENGDDAMFMAEGLAELSAGELYEFWLIDADGQAVAAGTLTDTDGVILATLERPIGEATTFAVTIETERVEQSVNDPVMVAALGA